LGYTPLARSASVKVQRINTSLGEDGSLRAAVLDPAFISGRTA